MTNCVMDRFGCPANVWLLCMVYFCLILNHRVEAGIGDSTMTLLMMSCFEMFVISPLLVFTFCQPVYVLLDDKEQYFPGNSKEVRGCFVVIFENIWHTMNLKILIDDSNKIVCRSIVLSALDSDVLNLRVKPDAGTNVIPTSVKADALHQVETQRKTCSKTQMKVQLLHSVPTHVAANTSMADADTDTNDESTVTDSFVFFKRDGEKFTKPLWKPFKVPLLDKNGEHCHNENGKPITIIACDPNYLHSTVFLTNLDEHGEIKKARVVEMIGYYKEILDKDRYCAQALQDLQCQVFYN